MMVNIVSTLKVHMDMFYNGQMTNCVISNVTYIVSIPNHLDITGEMFDTDNLRFYEMTMIIPELFSFHDICNLFDRYYFLHWGDYLPHTEDRIRVSNLAKIQSIVYGSIGIRYNY